MVLKFGTSKIGRQVALPWESIDPSDSLKPEDIPTQSAAGGEWFTNAPAGSWQMEPVEAKGEGSDEESAEAGEIATPFDGLESERESDGQPEGDHQGAAVEEEEAYPPRGQSDRGAWTISVLCMGLGLIAACLIIPQADANRRLVYQREQLRLDLAQVEKQIEVNKEFIGKMESDPQLTERLAQREMRAVQAGETVVNTGASTVGMSAERMSPFGIVNVPPPAALVPYKPVGGTFADLCRSPQTHMYVLGLGMFMVACGLVIGSPGNGVGAAMEAEDGEEDGKDFSTLKSKTS